MGLHARRGRRAPSCTLVWQLRGGKARSVPCERLPSPVVAKGVLGARIGRALRQRRAVICHGIPSLTSEQKALPFTQGLIDSSGPRPILPPTVCLPAASESGQHHSRPLSSRRACLPTCLPVLCRSSSLSRLAQRALSATTSRRWRAPLAENRAAQFPFHVEYRPRPHPLPIRHPHTSVSNDTLTHVARCGQRRPNSASACEQLPSSPNIGRVCAARHGWITTARYESLYASNST
jgi:hypothetical protein